MEPHGYLEWSIGELSRAMKITEDEVRGYFTDGRRVSYLIERRIAREVLKGTIAPTEGEPFDVFDKEQGKWEVRCITSAGVYFCPSYMVGSGRSFDAVGFLDKLAQVAGYVVADVVQFPSVPYWIVSSDTVRRWWIEGLLTSTTKISRSKALQLLRGEL